MGRVKEELYPDWEIEQRIKKERAEAEYFAVPEALHQNLALSTELKSSQAELLQQNAELRSSVATLSSALSEATSWQARWKERVIGFVLGCLASVAASLVWWQIAQQWPIFS